MAEIEEVQRQKKLAEARILKQQLAGGGARDRRAGHGGGTSYTPAEAFKIIDDVVRGLASGATFGFADEIAAGANTLTGLGEGSSYEENLARERERDASANPVARFGGEVFGGLMTGSAALRAGAKAAPKVAEALPGFFKATGSGAAMGGAYGLGHGEGGAGNRLEAAGTGALAGAATGAVLYPLIKIVEAGMSGAGRGVQNKVKPQSAAERKLLQSIERDELTVQKVRTRLRALGPQATIADAGGQNVAGLARAAAGVPGPAKNRAEMVLNARAQGEAGRLMTKVNQGLRPKDYYGAEDEFLATLKSNAKGLYDDAYKAGTQLESKELTKLLKRPIAEKAMREAAKLAGIEGRRLSRLDPELTARLREAVQRGDVDPRVFPEGGVGRGITTEAIDDLKRALDSIIERESNQLTGKLNKTGALVAEFKRQLLREVDRMNPAYGVARKTYSGDAEVLTALRDGRKALKLDPEQITRQMAGMSDAAKEAYRSGAARAIKDIVDATPDGTSAARRLGAKELNRSRLRAIFPDADTYNAFARALIGEQRFQQIRNMVLGGSPTAPRLAEQVDIGVDPGTVVSMAQGREGLISGAARAMMQKLTQPNPKMANELSRMMFSRNQAANQGTLDRIMQRAITAGANKQQIQALEQALIRALAQQEGAASGNYYSQRP